MAAIVVLVTALLTGPITLLRLAVPGGPWDLLTLVVAGVALESLLTTHWLVGRQADEERREVNPFLYRLAELAVLVIAMRFITWLALGNFPRTGRLARATAPTIPGAGSGLRPLLPDGLPGLGKGHRPGRHLRSPGFKPIGDGLFPAAGAR